MVRGKEGDGPRKSGRLIFGGNQALGVATIGIVVGPPVFRFGARRLKVNAPHRVFDVQVVLKPPRNDLRRTDDQKIIRDPPPWVSRLPNCSPQPLEKSGLGIVWAVTNVAGLRTAKLPIELRLFFPACARRH